MSAGTRAPFVWSTVPRFLHGVVGMTALLSLAFLWPNNHWAIQTVWTLILAYSLFCWTSCFHEAAHHTLCGSKPFSILVGRILGTMMFVPFSVYRESHIRHHAYLNKPTDWELWPYSDPTTSLWFRRLFCWLEIPFGVFTSPYVYSRLYFSPKSPLRHSAVHRTIGWEYVGIVVVWGTILSLAASFNAWPLLIRTWLVPHLIAGVMQTFRKFTEHLGMQSYDPLLGTRTVIGSSFLTKLCCYFNFDIFVHGPHHRHPRRRHEELCEHMREYQVGNPDTHFPVFSSYFAAVADVVPWIFRNPGVGMNVGASNPTVAEVPEVYDFGEDVTQEVLGRDEIVIAGRM